MLYGKLNQALIWNFVNLTYKNYIGFRFKQTGEMIRIIYICLLLNIITTAQEDSLKAYFPLETGNYWQYKEIYRYGQDTSIKYHYMEVLKDTIIDSNICKKIKSFDFGYPDFYDTIIYRSFDPSTGFVIEYFPSEQKKLLFKLNSVLNECFEVYCLDAAMLQNILGYSKPVKAYYFSTGWFRWQYYLAKDIGISKIHFDESYVIPTTHEYQLVYARINGIEYGEKVTSIQNKQINTLSYQLHQNFPNPFNPSTTIRYSIPVNCYVTLSVNNLLGEEVMKLVSEEQSAGEHSINFEAGGLSNGVYFYRLYAGNHIETKKMIFLK